MGIPSIRWLLSLVALGSLISLSNAYDIDIASCHDPTFVPSPGGTREDPYVTYIKEAVADAKENLAEGTNSIFLPHKGNSKQKLWHLANAQGTQQQLNTIQQNLAKVQLHPDLFVYKPGTSPLIYCGSQGFQKQADGSFLDAARGVTLKPAAGEIDKSNTLTAATTFRTENNKMISTNPNLKAVIMLYKATPGGVGMSPDTSGNRATLDQVLQQKADEKLFDPTQFTGKKDIGKPGIYDGKPLDRIVYYFTTSHVLLHEFVHVVQPVPITSGSKEVYGFKPMTGDTTVSKTVITTFDGALANAETYAAWCLCSMIEKKTGHAMIDGKLSVPPGSPALCTRTGGATGRNCQPRKPAARPATPVNTLDKKPTSRIPRPVNRLPATANSPSAINNRLPATNNRLPATNNRLPATNNRFPTTNSRLPGSNSLVTPPSFIPRPISNSRGAAAPGGRRP